MNKKSTFHCLFLILLLKSSFESNVTKERCYQYKDCWTCVRDPCSRRQEAEDVNNICVWCYNYLDVGSGCISTRRDRACLPQPIKYAAQCQLEPMTRALTASKETSLRPFVTKNYLVHLEYLSNDIFGTIKGEARVDHYKVVIAIGRNVTTKSIVDMCGSYTPISAVEADNILPSSPPIGNSNRCWNLGRVISIRPTLLDTSNPQDGIVLDFGTSPCCCGSNKTTYINTTVVLKEGYCQYNSVNSSVTAGNIDLLTNCSERIDYLQFVVQTSVLCPNRLEWRLSVDKMTAFCTKTEAKEYMYRCAIRLKPAVPGVVIASSSRYCQNNIMLWKRFENGSEVNASLDLSPSGKDTRDSCSFVVDSNDICHVSLVYLYADASPQLISINGSSSLQLGLCNDSNRPLRSVWWFWVAVVLGALCLAFSSYIVYRYCPAISKFLHPNRKGYELLKNSKNSSEAVEDCETVRTSTLKATNAKTHRRFPSAPDQVKRDTDASLMAGRAQVQSAEDNGYQREEIEIHQGVVG